MEPWPFVSATCPMRTDAGAGRPQPTDVGIAVQDGQTPSQYAEGEALLTASGRSLDDLHEQIRVALEEAHVYET